MTILLIYIVNIALLAGIAYWCFLRYGGSQLRIHYWPALIFKVSCGFLLGLLFYRHYGGGDTIRYYEEATLLADLNVSDFFKAWTEPVLKSQPFRAIYFTRLVALLKWSTHANYWVLSVYFSLFSFLGSFYLLDKLVTWRSHLKIPGVVAFLYFPSIVFWSSGLLKESLVFGAVTFLIGAYLSWANNRRVYVGHLFIGIVSLAIIISLKYYIAAALLPLLIYLILYHLIHWDNWKINGIWKKTFLLATMLVIPTVMWFNRMSVNLNYERLWQVMKKNHDLYIQMAPDGAMHTLAWFNNSWDLLINIPFLLFSGLFRPLFGEDFTFPAFFSGVENLLLLLAVVLGLIVRARNLSKWTPELLALLLYVSALSIFLSYSAPNFGTLARFKVYYSPWVLLLAIASVQNHFSSGKK